MNKDFKKGFLISLWALTALLIPTIIYIGSKAISPKDDLHNISKYCDKVVNEHQKKKKWLDFLKALIKIFTRLQSELKNIAIKESK